MKRSRYMPQESVTSGAVELNEVENKVLAVYDGLKDLLQRDDAPPCVTFAARHALATLYPAVNALGLRYEFLIEYGI
jgi:hypothetical protein